MRTKGLKDDRYVEAASKVVDGLRGDAFVVAQEVGFENLWSPQEVAIDSGDDTAKAGIEKLIEAMKASVFPLTNHEAKEMFRQYCKPTGSLSRQNGESMTQYISRRRRCWKLL